MTSPKMRKAILTLAAVIGLAVVGATATAQAAEASSSCYYSPRGCVSVGGYYKPSTGTYVRPHVRNYPGYGGYSPSYGRPSYSRPSYSRPSYSYPSYW
jgi:hypothetical protein